MVPDTNSSSKLNSFVGKSKRIKEQFTSSILKASFLSNVLFLSRSSIRAATVSSQDVNSSGYDLRLAGLDIHTRALELGKTVSFNYTGKYWFYAFGLIKPNNNKKCDE